MARFGVTALDLYGVSGSPIVLKKKYKEIVNKSGLAEQISEKLEELCKMVEDKRPETGLDAQSIITYLIVKGKTKELLDIRKFKQSLYNRGIDFRSNSTNTNPLSF